MRIAASWALAWSIAAPRDSASCCRSSFVGRAIDTIVLGCTHYPLLRAVIEVEARAMLGEHVVVVDSAHATAASVAAFLNERALAREPRAERGSVHLLATDVPKTFAEQASRFLGKQTGIDVHPGRPEVFKSAA